MNIFRSLGLIFLSEPILASGIESGRSRRVSAMLPLCDSERPNSWATHRTLTVPESCLTGSVAEIAMTKALCCVYTHVVVGSGSTNTAFLETYDGSVYTIGDCDASNTSVQVMEDVIGRVCGMSMGNQDCYNQRLCLENAKTTSAPTSVLSTSPTHVPSAAPAVPTSAPTSDDSTTPTGVPSVTPTQRKNPDDEKPRKSDESSGTEVGTWSPWWMLFVSLLNFILTETFKDSD